MEVSAYIRMEIQEAFDISIPGDRASEMLTVGDLYESRSRTDIWNALQLIAAEQFGVDRIMVEPLVARFTATSVSIFAAPQTQPVPEPTSMAIFGLGALGFAYRARRKSKAQA
ncbi:MAG: PEP-CTERM sorting domain-containing protein [Planctomycetota bacterium]